MSFVPIACRLPPRPRRSGHQVRQSIRLTKSADGTTIAWAEAGSGPALVKASNWLTHLEYDAESPIWRHWIQFLRRTLPLRPLRRARLRHERVRRCGAVRRALGRGSRGSHRGRAAAGAVRAARYLARRFRGDSLRRRASRAGFAPRPLRSLCAGSSEAGRPPDSKRRARARIALTRSGWGQNNPVYRQLFTSRFVPGASDEQIRWFNDLCRMHGDGRDGGAHHGIPPARRRYRAVAAGVGADAGLARARRRGRDRPRRAASLAARIPAPTLVELDSRNHILLEAGAGVGAVQARGAGLHRPVRRGCRRRRRAAREPVGARARHLAEHGAGLHERRDRPRALHQRENRAQSCHADLREARRALTRAGDRARAESWIDSPPAAARTVGKPSSMRRGGSA